MISLVALLASACGAVKKPVVTPQSMTIGSPIIGLNPGIRGTVNFAIENPNAFSLPIKRGNWQLALNNSRVTSGDFVLSETIPAGGSTTMNASLELRASDIITIARVMKAGAKTYMISGALAFDSPLGEVVVAFSHEGDVQDLEKLARPF